MTNASPPQGQGIGLIVADAASGLVRSVNAVAALLLPEVRAGGHLDDPGSPMPPLQAALEGEVHLHHGGRTLAVGAGMPASTSTDVVWTVSDITTRERRERARGEFVATAAHELRSPLTSIKGFVELLEQGQGELSERQREFVDIIKRSTDRLVDMVNDLLDVARLEAEQVQVDRRPIDIGEAVHELA